MLATLRILIATLALVLAGGGRSETLVVSAASSLTEAFEAIAVVFERASGARVDLNIAGSSTLAAQIVQGAPVDVFASADLRQMEVVRQAGRLASEPVTFARNRLVVIAVDDGPVRSLADLATPGVLVVLAGPEVPAGAYARAALVGLVDPPTDRFAERVLANVVSEEPNVRQAAAKVALGEADAAIVYASDAAVLKGVRTIALPDVPGVQPSYPVGILERAADPELARAFVTFLRSDEGQAILHLWGFAPADAARDASGDAGRDVGEE